VVINAAGYNGTICNKRLHARGMDIKEAIAIQRHASRVSQHENVFLSDIPTGIMI
jgi:hypothetical protein